MLGDVDSFIEEYEKLCIKYGYYIDMQADDTLAIFPTKGHEDKVFTLRMEELKNAD